MPGEHSIKISMDVAGTRALESFFDHAYHVPDDWRGAWEPMAEDFWQAEREIFAQEGPGWAELTPKYKAWKTKHYPGMPLLVRTGALEASLTQFDAEGAIYDVYPTEMSLGTDLKVRDGKYTLGMLHQTGTRRGLPPRPPLQVKPGLQRQWNRRLATWMREEFGYQG